MQQAPNSKITSEEHQKALYTLWQHKIQKVIPLRAAHQEAIKINPQTLRTFEHEKLEVAIASISQQLAPAFQADLDAEIKEAELKVMVESNPEGGS